MKLRRVLGITLTAFGALSAPLLGLLALAATETGSRWIVDRAVPFVAGTLSFDEFEGTLLGRLTFHHLAYQLNLHRVEAERLTLDWAPGALFQGLVHVRSLEGNGIRYAGPQAPAKQDDLPLPRPDLRPPLPVQLDQLVIDNLDIRQGESRQRVQHILVQADLDASGLTLENLQADMHPLRVKASGRAGAQPPYAFELALSWNATPAEQEQFTGDGQIEGDITAMRLVHRLSAPFEVNTRGQAAFPDDGPTIQLEGDWRALYWPLAGDPLYRSRSGQYRIEGPLEALQVSLETWVFGSQIPPVQARLTATGRPSSLDIKEAVLDTLEGQLIASGQIGWEPHLRWDLTVQGHDINPGVQWSEWPGNLALDGRLRGDIHDGRHDVTAEIRRLTGRVRDEPVEAQARIDLLGSLDAYKFTLDGSVSSGQIPTTRASLVAQGGSAGLNIQELVVDTLEGRITSTGEIAWAPQLNWDLALRANDINPGGHWPDLPGKLELDAQATGEVIQGEPHLAFQVRRLGGHLRDYPLRGRGRVELRGETLRARGLEISSGNNRIQINGEVSEDLDLAVDLDAPQLAGVWPGLQGTIKGKARVAGRRDNPRLQAQADGKDLVFGDLAADHIAIDLNLDPDAPESSLAKITGRDVMVGGVVTKALTLSGSGNLERHQVSLIAHADQGEVDMAVSGGMRDHRWYGRLTKARVEHPDSGRWDLKDPVELIVDRSVAQVAHGCWTQAEAKLCAAGRWQGALGVEAEGDITALPLSVTGPFLPEGVALEGLLDGSFNADGKGQALRLSADLKPRPGEVVYRPAEGEPLHLAYRDAAFKASYDGRLATLDWSLGLAAEGRADGRLAVDLLPGHPSPVMQGEINAHLPDLAMVTPFVPRLHAVQGSLDIALRLGGNVDRPEIEGRAEIKQASARLPDLGLHITDLVLNAQNRGSDVITFRGAARSGPGTLDLDGEVQLSATTGWPLTLAVRGQDFEVARLPQVTALASPDLRLSLKGGSAELAGKIVVPKAEIELKELPQEAVAISEDEIVIGEALPADAKTGPALKLSSRVELELGDEVSFQGFGLETGLAGRINVTSRPGSVALGEGQVSLKEGRYRAYGQNLAIDKGKLLFVGPVDNPGLDVRATRKAGAVTAGLEVTGTLKSPNSRVFSTPAMSEAEALSYLLTGRGLAGGSEDDAAMLSQVALSLGLKQSSTIAQQIAQTVGLDELTVASEGDVEESSLLLGKYLTPDLYVHYAYGLFDTQGTLKLRYQLTDSVSVEAHSGEAQGADLLYSIERD